MYTCIFFSFLARRIFLCAGLWHAAVHLAPERVRVYARLRVRAEIARTITPSSGRRSPDNRGYLLRGITIIIVALYYYGLWRRSPCWRRRAVARPLFWKMCMYNEHEYNIWAAIVNKLCRALLYQILIKI